jgi:DNA-nicking Smr family endonuclease
MPKQRPADRPDSAEAAADAQAFRAAVRDVTPLQHTPSALAAAPKKRVRRRAAPAVVDTLDETMPLVAADATTADGALSFQRGGVRLQVVRRLRRGLYPIDDELDLHGLTQSAAREHLAQFIVRSRDAGCRCVRIIHGKGYRSGARGPVLKTAVNQWLRRHLDVMAFVSARAIDGGAGALYVLLRA